MDDNADIILMALMVEPTETNLEQISVFLETFQIFLDRNEKYGDLWKEYGSEDIALHVRSKFLRLEKTGDIDDALDLLNYVVFWIRLRRGEK